jgi:hypothetical protein
MPAPKKGAAKKKVAAAPVPEAADGAPKAVKGRKPPAPMMPVYDPLPGPDK